jgi:hypothetical protein
MRSPAVTPGSLPKVIDTLPALVSEPVAIAIENAVPLGAE